MNKAVLDTNLYIGWLNRGLNEDLMHGHGLVRYLSAVVHMELRSGAVTRSAKRAVDQIARAYAVGGRLVAPSTEVFGQAGVVLQKLRATGREVRRASLAHDVLIALTARSLGATLFTSDGTDFEAIRSVSAFRLELVRPPRPSNS